MANQNNDSGIRKLSMPPASGGLTRKRPKQRSEMTDEEQLASPEQGVEEASFVPDQGEMVAGTPAEGRVMASTMWVPHRAAAMKKADEESGLAKLLQPRRRASTAAEQGVTRAPGQKNAAALDYKNLTKRPAESGYTLEYSGHNSAPVMKKTGLTPKELDALSDDELAELLSGAIK